jgi:hypothetical protein
LTFHNFSDIIFIESEKPSPFTIYGFYIVIHFAQVNSLPGSSMPGGFICVQKN